MSSVFRESGIGSYRVESGMLSVDAASGRDGVASGQEIEADGAPVGGAAGVAVGGEGGSGRDGPGTGFGHCSDGLASCP